MNKISILVYILLFFLSGCNSDKQEKLYDRAVFCYRSREFYDAIRILEQMNNSKFCEKEKLLGSSYYELESYNKAIFHYSNYQEKCDSDFLVFINKSSSFEKLNKLDSSLYCLEEAKKIDSTSSILNFNFGVVHYKMKNYPTALKYLKKNLFNSPDKIDFDSYDFMEEILLEENKYVEVVQITDSLLTNKYKDQDYFRLLLRKIYIQGDMGDWKKMRDQITQIIDNNYLSKSNRLNAYYNIYMADYKLNDKDNGCKNYKILTEDLKSNEVENLFNCK